MSSISTVLAQASGKARRQYQDDELLRTVRLQNKLATDANVVAQDSARNKNLGLTNITPLKAVEYQSAEDAFADSSLQYRKALENARQLLSVQDDASTFVQMLSNQIVAGTNLNEIQFFNRYFDRFKKDVTERVSLSTLTPAFLDQLWKAYFVTVGYFELKGNKYIDFQNVGNRIEAQQYLANFGEVLKDKLLDLPYTPAEVSDISRAIDDAVLDENKPFLEDLNQKFNNYLNNISFGPAPKVVPASAIKAPPSSVKKLKATVGVIPDNATDLRVALSEAFGLDDAKVSGPTDLIGAFNASADQREIIRNVLKLATDTYGKYPVQVAADKTMKQYLRAAIVLGELARANFSNGYPFNITEYDGAMKRIGRKFKPAEVASEVGDYIISTTPTSFAAAASSSGSSALGPAPVIPSSMPSGAPVAPSAPAVTPAKPRPPPKTKKGPPAPKRGSGLPKKTLQRIYSGEIEVGNNNLEIKKKLFKLRN